MAGVFSRTLKRISSSSLSSSSSSRFILSPRILSHRNRSNQSGKGQLVEVDLESDGSGSDVDVMSVRKLEDVIHGIIVRRSAPDWLPFIPGSSYWVPPRKRSSGGFVDMLEKFAKPLSVEEGLSCANSRGWPSSSYFIDGTTSMHPVPVEFHVQVEVEDNSDDDASQSNDQEG